MSGLRLKLESPDLILGQQYIDQLPNTTQALFPITRPSFFRARKPKYNLNA